MQRFSKVKILLKRSTLSDGGDGLIEALQESSNMERLSAFRKTALPTWPDLQIVVRNC